LRSSATSALACFPIRPG